MGNRKVSIIVPVYKVEKYLEECLESLKNQTYKNLEIILCNDESPDKCPEICEKYARIDERFKVVHKKNGGAASARNAGLEIITGEYVGFVDGDDWVEVDYVSKLVENLEKDGADISVCSFANVYMNKDENIEMEKDEIHSEKEFLERFLWDWKCGLLWNKLFKRELIENVRFAEGHVIDDEFFTYKVVMNAKKITVSKEILVFYRQRKSGAMNQGKKQRMLMDRMQYLTERYEDVTQKYPELKKVYLENLSDNIIRILREAMSYEETRRMGKKLWVHYMYSVLSGKLSIKQKYAYIKVFFEKKNKNQIYEENKKFYFE